MKSGCLKWILRAVVALLTLIVVLFLVIIVHPIWGWPGNTASQGPVPITPAWAMEPWVWEDDHNTEAFVDELLAGYKEHDFPVQTILIDSPWSTRYNDFNIDTNRYPHGKDWFRGLQDRGYRVVLWMTCMVDSKSKDLVYSDSHDWWKEAADKGYTTGGDYQMSWWQGLGGFIDYSNPEAMKWWTGMQKQVLDLGVDGWKLDGADALFNWHFLPYSPTHGGWMTMREYMHHYARDEYQNGLKENPEFITMIRSVDDQVPYLYWWGFAPLDASPVNWVGDERHKWSDDEKGMETALKYILRSAKLGYAVVGSDIGGYQGEDIPPNIYMRWAQFSAFTPFYLLGGHGERRLWMRTPQELEVIRKFTWLHHELVPYFYSLDVACHNGDLPPLRPSGPEYGFMLGDDFYCAPIHKDSLTQTVTLPAGRWRYLFKDDEVIQGPTTLTRDFPMDEFPVYIRDGAVVPMNIERDYTGIGQKDWAGHLTLNLYPTEQTNSFEIVQPDGSGKTSVGCGIYDGGKNLRVYVDGVHKPHILRARLDKKPQGVSLDGAALAEGSGWTYDEPTHRFIVKTETYTDGKYVVSL